MKNKTSKINQFFKTEISLYLTLALAACTLILLAVIISPASSENSNIFIEIGSLKITWYAVFIMFGVMLATILAFKEFKKYNVKTDILYDGLAIHLVTAIIGARLYYVIFDKEGWNRGTYQNIGDWFNFANGGLAITGGIIAAIITLYFFCRVKKLSFWFIADALAIGLLVGQIMGRWGNFMNQEAYGPIITQQFILNLIPDFILDRMNIGGNYHHPMFLYESLWNLLGVILLLIARRKRLFKLGDMLGLYLIWYGLGRGLLIEPFREDPLFIGTLKVNILVSLTLLPIGGLAIIFGKKLFYKKQVYYVDYNKEAVIFDLDGTLLDTKEIIIKSYEHVFSKFLPNIKLTQKEYLSFIGPTLEQTFSKYTKDEKVLKNLIEQYRTFNVTLHDKGVMMFDGVKETLEYLRSKKISLAIVSSKSKKMVIKGLDQHELTKYFDLIIGSDDCKNHKPDKEPLIKALDLLNVSSNNALYVGDHPNDILCAKNADVSSCLVSYSDNLDEAIKQNPDYIIDSVDKIIDLI